MSAANEKQRDRNTKEVTSDKEEESEEEVSRHEMYYDLHQYKLAMFFT